MHKKTIYLAILLCFSGTTHAQNIRKGVLRDWYADVSNYKEYLEGKIDTISWLASPDTNKGIGRDIDYISWQHQHRRKFKMVILPGKQWGLSTPLISSVYKWNVRLTKECDYILSVKSKDAIVKKYQLTPHYNDDVIEKIVLVKTNIK